MNEFKVNPSNKLDDEYATCERLEAILVAIRDAVQELRGMKILLGNVIQNIPPKYVDLGPPIPNPLASPQPQEPIIGHIYQEKPKRKYTKKSEGFDVT